MDRSAIKRSKHVRSFTTVIVVLACGAGAIWADSANNPPDLTGIWGIYRGGPGSDPKYAPSAPSALVLKPEYAKPYEEKRAVEAAAAKRGEQIANGGVECIPYGVPTMMSVALYPVEFIQTAKQVTIISEAFSEVRRVYLDRPQANLDDVAPGYYGRSVGHWEGDTLVVDTTNFKGSYQSRFGVSYLDGMSDENLHVVERFRRADPETIIYQATVDDPTVYTKPWTVELSMSKRAGRIFEYACHEGNYAMMDILAGARAEEKKAAASKP